MPAVSEKQRKFMGAELNRKRAGKKTKTGMSESKLSEFASKSRDIALSKAIAMIDFHLLKHGKVLLCGHHADEGSDFDKACATCSAGSSNPQQGKSGTVYAPSTDNVSSGIHLPYSGSGSSGGATGSGTMTSSSPPEGGFQRSADPITLINNYLFKHGRILPCGHHASERTDDKDIEDISKEVCLPCQQGATTVTIDPTMTADDL